jgi:hypothetical protein
MLENNINMLPENLNAKRQDDLPIVHHGKDEHIP